MNDQNQNPEIKNPKNNLTSTPEPLPGNPAPIDPTHSNVPSSPDPVHSLETKSRKSRKKLLIVLLVILLIILCVVGALIYKDHHKTKKVVAVTVTKSQPKPTVKTQTTQSATPPFEPILTYSSTTTPQTFIATDSQNKILAKVTIAQADNKFSVYAENQQALLLAETHNTSAFSAGTDPTYVLVNYNGSDTTLSSTASAVITAEAADSTYSTSQYFLNGNTSMIYVNCSKTAQNCTLDSLNLSTGAVTSYISAAGDQSSIILMGVSNNVVYYYASNSVVAYNLQTRTTLHTFALQVTPLNAPVISNDYLQAVYTDQNNDGTRYLVNLSTGKTTTLSSSIASDNEDYIWSPDNKYIAFTTPYPSSPSTTSQASIDYIDLSTGTTASVKSFGDPQYNQLDMNAWTSSSELYYLQAKTTTPNDFGTSTKTYNEINIPGGTVSPDPAPSGYVFTGIPAPSVYDVGP